MSMRNIAPAQLKCMSGFSPRLHFNIYALLSSVESEKPGLWPDVYMCVRAVDSLVQLATSKSRLEQNLQISEQRLGLDLCHLKKPCNGKVHEKPEIVFGTTYISSTLYIYSYSYECADAALQCTLVCVRSIRWFGIAS